MIPEFAIQTLLYLSIQLEKSLGSSNLFLERGPSFLGMVQPLPREWSTLLGTEFDAYSYP